MESFFDIFNVPFGWLLNLSYKITGNYVFALLIFAFAIKLVLLPFGIKQHKNSLKQASLRPREAAIIKKYAGRTDKVTQHKKQEEIQRLYQSENYSQLAGCLPMLIQLPIIMCIYNVIKNPLRYLCGLGSETVNVIVQHAKNITGDTSLDYIGAMNVVKNQRDAFVGLEQLKDVDIAGLSLPNFTFFGIDLSQTPKFGLDILIIIPIITFIAVFFSTKITRRLSYQSPQMSQNSPDVKASMTIMELIMPLISTFITFGVPAAIGIYWIYNNLLGILQQLIFVKVKPYPVFTEEDYKEAERLMAGKRPKKKKVNKDPDRPRVRSLHHIDDDEYNAKVVENAPNKAEGGAQSPLISPVPMKDYPKKKK